MATIGHEDFCLNFIFIYFYFILSFFFSLKFFLNLVFLKMISFFNFFKYYFLKFYVIFSKFYYGKGRPPYFPAVWYLEIVKLALLIGFVVPIYISQLKKNNDFNRFCIFLKDLKIFDPWKFFLVTRFSTTSLLGFPLLRYSLLVTSLLCLVTPTGLVKRTKLEEQSFLLSLDC